MNELKKLLENAGIRNEEDEWPFDSESYNSKQQRPIDKATPEKDRTRWQDQPDDDVEEGIEDTRRVRIEDVFQDIKDHVSKGQAGQSITIKIKDAGKTLPGSVFQYEITVDQPGYDYQEWKPDVSENAGESKMSTGMTGQEFDFEMEPDYITILRHNQDTGVTIPIENWDTMVRAYNRIINKRHNY